MKDTAFLQETTFVYVTTPDYEAMVEQVFHSSFNNCSITAILLHKHVQFSSEQVISDPSGHCIIVVGVLFQTPYIMPPTGTVLIV